MPMKRRSRRTAEPPDDINQPASKTASTSANNEESEDASADLNKVEDTPGSRGRKRQMSKKMQDYLEEQEKKRMRKSLPKSPKKQRKSEEMPLLTISDVSQEAVTKPECEGVIDTQTAEQSLVIEQTDIILEEQIIEPMAPAESLESEESGQLIQNNNHVTGDQQEIVTEDGHQDPTVSVETEVVNDPQHLVDQPVVQEEQFITGTDVDVTLDGSEVKDVMDQDTHAMEAESTSDASHDQVVIVYTNNEVTYEIQSVDDPQPEQQQIVITNSDSIVMQEQTNPDVIADDGSFVQEEHMSTVIETGQEAADINAACSSVEETSEATQVLGNISLEGHVISDYAGKRNFKLTEEVRIDEHGREQHIVFLSPEDLAAPEDNIINNSTSTQKQTLITEPETVPTIPTNDGGLLFGGRKLVKPRETTGMPPSGTSSNNLASIPTVVHKQSMYGAMSQNNVIMEVLVENPSNRESALEPFSPEEFCATATNIGGDETYKCNICPNYKTTYKYDMQKHYKRLHNDERPYSCSECDHKARTMSNLRRHWLTHTNERKFVCEFCDQKFKQKIHLDKHVNYKHKEKEVQCPYCDYTCANAIPDLKLHMKRKHLKLHPDDPPTYLECPKCGFLAGSKKDLKQHSKFHKPGPELKLFCEHCSFVTDALSRLKRHMMIHSKEKPFSCPHCEYKASQKEHIKRHLKTRHQIEDSNDITMSSVNSAADDSRSCDASQLGADNSETDTQNSQVVFLDDNSQTSDKQTDVVVEVETIPTENSIPERPAATIEEEIVAVSSSTSADNTTTSTANTTTSAATTREEDVNEDSQDSEKSAIKRKQSSLKYIPPDYSQKEKLFGCSHCTMKFVRLLSLYKHLHTQHADLLPNTEEERLTCVVCDFKAPSHKSLLVHMRKHNQQESEEHNEPGKLYLCVLCKYMNPKRRNLYQHLKKKHKISLIVKKDGTACCTVEPNADVTVVASEPGQQVTEVVGMDSDNPQAASNDSNVVVSIVELANSLTKKLGVAGLVQEVDANGRHTEQAAAEAIVDLASQNVHEETISSAILESDDTGHGQIQLSAAQLHQLSAGDLIEINGETYKIEYQGNTVTAVLCEQIPQVVQDLPSEQQNISTFTVSTDNNALEITESTHDIIVDTESVHATADHVTTITSV